MTDEVVLKRVPNKEDIIKSIVDAFAKVSCPFELADFSHDELIQARFEIPYEGVNYYEL